MKVMMTDKGGRRVDVIFTPEGQIEVHRKGDRPRRIFRRRPAAGPWTPKYPKAKVSNCIEELIKVKDGKEKAGGPTRILLVTSEGKKTLRSAGPVPTARSRRKPDKSPKKNKMFSGPKRQRGKTPSARASGLKAQPWLTGKRYSMQRRAAFTLIELLVVIAIIGVPLVGSCCWRPFQRGARGR